MTTHFENPPISELVIGVYFDPPLNKLRSEHVGLFWAENKTDFPNTEQVSPLINQKNAFGSFFSGDDSSLFPRFWLKSADEITLLQIQRNALLFNWRKKDKGYLSYDALKKKFDEYYDKYVMFIKQTIDEEVSLAACEITYINIIEEGSYWNSLLDTQKVIPSFSIPNSGIKNVTPKGCHLTAVYSIEDDFDLTVKISNGTNKEEKKVLYYELRASCDLAQKNKSFADVWFRRAHDMINDCFKGMTNSDIQTNIWKPKK